mmetsp:Transcript_45867/g.94715  ORF Transcript_45867/g.94715 Transcript_45867/m.94715 type:complete len:223 (-) Transcript_45867:537-1205(-)
MAFRPSKTLAMRLRTAVEVFRTFCTKMPGASTSVRCSGVSSQSFASTALSSPFRSTKIARSSSGVITVLIRLMTTPEGFRTPPMFPSSRTTDWRCHKLRRLKTSPHQLSRPSSSTSRRTSCGRSSSRSLPRRRLLLRRRLERPLDSWADSCLGCKVIGLPPRLLMVRRASEIRLIATPEGFAARWIFKPDSITASHCSDVRPESRSTTPSPRSLTLMNIWIL